jgi:hypothetical protein
MTKNVNFVSTHLGLPYTGSADPELSESQHTEKVVLALLADKLDSGHSVFMDNYYNSVNLTTELLQRNKYLRYRNLTIESLK